MLPAKALSAAMADEPIDLPGGIVLRPFCALRYHGLYRLGNPVVRDEAPVVTLPVLAQFLALCAMPDEELVEESLSGWCNVERRSAEMLARIPVSAFPRIVQACIAYVSDATGTLVALGAQDTSPLPSAPAPRTGAGAAGAGRSPSATRSCGSTGGRGSTSSESPSDGPARCTCSAGSPPDSDPSGRATGRKS